MNNKTINIYKDYILAKISKNSSVNDVFKKHKISKSALYVIVRKIETGNKARVRRAFVDARLDVLWEHRYKARYKAIPKGRSEVSITMLKKLLKEMKKDKFTPLKTASFMGKHHTTVSYHLKNA